MSSRVIQFLSLAVCLLLISLSGCRAGQMNRPGIFQQPGVVSNQPTVGRQLGQRAGNIAINRLINAGITRIIGGF